MSFRSVLRSFPSWQNAALALISAVLLVLAFPPFEWWFTAWFALVPLLWAIHSEKRSLIASFVLGWLFGNLFFFATCWWLTFAPIMYAGFPPLLAYSLLFCVTSTVGIFTGVFAAVMAILLRRFGNLSVLAAPAVWVFSEFLRFWFTGNNWNALGYSQAFAAGKGFAQVGGVYLTGAVAVLISAALMPSLMRWDKGRIALTGIVWVAIAGWFGVVHSTLPPMQPVANPDQNSNYVVAVQPNVPMAGLTQSVWAEYRARHRALAESALSSIAPAQGSRIGSRTVIFPESPMNFMYEAEPETQLFIDGFARSHNVSVLFNSAEPDAANDKYFNSAVMVGREGREIAQYDKIYLLPFGEAVPWPLEGMLPGFVGNFSYGREYDLLPLGDAKAGVMICFESHFGQLSRRYVRYGADAIIEMTNDGYLGPTPVLRQHLANAVFRAVETNRPVLRVTNVGITAYINERGEVLDAAEPYTEATRVWSVSKSDGSQTLYVKYGDWFPWLCSAVTLVLLALSFRKR